MSASWFRRKIQNIINLKEAAKKIKTATNQTETGSITTNSPLNENDHGVVLFDTEIVAGLAHLQAAVLGLDQAAAYWIAYTEAKS